jgi:trehalose/maltose hydrolase-like predicted phosphorylase
VLLQPPLAESLLLYRNQRLDAAFQKAADFGYKGMSRSITAISFISPRSAGALYPWESGFTGTEVCPALLEALCEQHIAADVSFAVQQYYHATHNVTWLEQIGWPILEGECHRCISFMSPHFRRTK